MCRNSDGSGVLKRQKMRTAYLIFPIIALLTAACAKEAASVSLTENVPMRLYSRAEGVSDGTSAEPAVFLFWDFGDIMAQTEHPVPLAVCYPERPVSAYARPDAPYNTGRLYPDGNRRALVNGYAPSSLIPSEVTADGEIMTDYEHLSVPEDGLCVTDVLTSLKPLTGSASLPFDRQNGETLEFVHAMSKVTFKARLADDMSRFIRHVRISPHRSLVVNRLNWDRDGSIYKAEAYWETGLDDYPYMFGQPADADQLTPQLDADVCRLYLTPRQMELPVTVTVERAGNVQFTGSREVSFETLLAFDIARNMSDSSDLDKSGNLKNNDMLYENEAYTFTLVFGEEGIELIGKKCAWEDGGNIIIPVYPVLPEDESAGAGTDAGE